MPAPSTDKATISFTVNGEAKTVETWPMKRLLDVLREELGLTGTKEGCGEGECGACAVFINGRMVNTCLVPAIQASNAKITTIEGLATGDSLHAVQQAFIDFGGAQCGICTPGMVIAAVELLRKYPDPTQEQVAEGLSGNLCRCTGYMKIFDSVLEAAKTMIARQGDQA
ncbi:MAG: carbon-monoxide dehydrogenase small subunit [Myxococcota bacterium]|jgi:carbon-monoxide dehydrogenase small subunit